MEFRNDESFIRRLTWIRMKYLSKILEKEIITKKDKNSRMFLNISKWIENIELEIAQEKLIKAIKEYEYNFINYYKGEMKK